MNNLIKNELIKIIKKGMLQRILIVTIVMCVFVNIMNKMMDQDNEYYTEEIQKSYQEDLKSAKENQNSDWARECKAYLDAYEIAKKYEPGSWQRYIVQAELEPLIDNMERTKGQEGYAVYKGEYDRMIKLIDSNNWKIYAQEQLDNAKSQLKVTPDEETKKMLEDEKQMLEWRLEKNIPYGQSALNTYLYGWLNARNQIREYEKINNPTKEEQIANQKNIETMKICEYAINNNLDYNIVKPTDNDIYYQLPHDGKSTLLEATSSFTFFIVLAAITVAGNIMSEEFNKGTIKLLLVRPYKRTKILIAKFITCLIVLAIAIISIGIVHLIIGGIIYGFDSFGHETVVYNFNTNSIQVQSSIQALLLSIAYLLPAFILELTIAFAIGTIFTSTVLAIAVPVIILTEEVFINMLVTTVPKAKFLIYFITPNWDWSKYATGEMQQLKELTLPFSVAVCSVYFIVLLGLSIYSFNKKNIKNI